MSIQNTVPVQDRATGIITELPMDEAMSLQVQGTHRVLPQTKVTGPTAKSIIDAQDPTTRRVFATVSDETFRQVSAQVRRDGITLGDAMATLFTAYGRGLVDLSKYDLIKSP